ncbi:MAG: hypothetical protein CM15mP51_18520 [Porticoccaceae bacterium]|nr:MAG: hypothetical protein CM15mP51_18520 [Porticoccaceae bacterium]
MADVEDSAYFDGKTTLEALNRLNQLSKNQKPFFLAVGFVKPHLPFNAPKSIGISMITPKSIARQS